MNDLPYEITKDILLCLSPRYVAQCSLINKTFYTITRDPIFYHSVNLYTMGQTEKFLNMAKTTTTYGKPIGYWIQQLKIDTYLQKRGYRIIMSLMIELRCACPNALFIGFSDIAAIPIFDYAQSSDDKSIVDDLCDNRISLQLDAVSEIESENGILKYQTVNEQQRQNSLGVTSILNMDTNDLNSNENIRRPFYNGNILQLSLSFRNLKEVHLQNFSYYHLKQYQRSEKYLCDERMIDALHVSCPHIEILHLYKFDMVHRHDLERNITPCTTLKTLKIESHAIVHPASYTYFSLKYPLLSTLDISLEEDSEYESDQPRFCEAVYSMITSFSYLNHLSFSTSDRRLERKLFEWLESSSNKLKTFNTSTGVFGWVDYSSNDDLNSEEIIDPIVGSDDENGMAIVNMDNDIGGENIMNENSGIPLPIQSGNPIDPIQQLNSFNENLMNENISSSLSTHSDNTIYSIQQQQQHNYLNDAIERSMQMIDTSVLLNYILENKYNNIIPPSTTKLTLRLYDTVEQPFPIDKWLYALLNLKCLTLYFVFVEPPAITGKFSQLQHLSLYQCDISTPTDITSICQMCPFLRSLELMYISFKTKNESLPQIVIDAPQLTFEKLIIVYTCYCYLNNGKWDGVLRYASKLTVNELKLNNTFTMEVDKYNQDDNTEIIMNCQSADVVLFNNKL
ncbi:hypothetical protein BJ944DRAFT_267727 [Cunninghamella echinulata]|nr:hypothetical protein BJ944DRAFT_267727 [Cunninghamella echinulata]